MCYCLPLFATATAAARCCYHCTLGFSCRLSYPVDPTRAPEPPLRQQQPVPAKDQRRRILAQHRGGPARLSGQPGGCIDLCRHRGQARLVSPLPHRPLKPVQCATVVLVASSPPPSPLSAVENGRRCHSATLRSWFPVFTRGLPTQLVWAWPIEAQCE
jgi:hypothetical protein